MVKLGDICKFQSGGTPSKSNPLYFGGEIPWITTVALNGGIINEGNAVEWITEKALAESAAKLVPANSIMVGTRVGIGKVAINSVPMSTSQDVISLLEIDETRWSKPFLCRYLLSQTEFLQAQARGATIKGIKIDTLSKLLLPEIDLAQQYQIAAVFQKLTRLISLRQEQLDKLDELVKSRFVEMFDGGNYPHVALIDLIKDEAGLSYGIVQPGNDGTGDMGVLRPVDIVDGRISIDSIKYIDRSIGDRFRKTELTGDELLITVRGTTGITALTDFRFKGMNVTRGIAVVRYDREKIDPVYLNSYLNTEDSQQYIQEHTRGATLQQINLSDLRVQQVMVPSLPLQNQFSAFVSQTEKTKTAVQKSLQKLETLKKSLMQQYFG